MIERLRKNERKREGARQREREVSTQAVPPYIGQECMEEDVSHSSLCS